MLRGNLDLGKKSKRDFMFEIFLTHRAEKALKSINMKLKSRIEVALDDLSYTYFPRKYEIKKLKGFKNTYRIRISNYRIIYLVDFKKSSIFILSIAQRPKSILKIRKHIE